jgi:hypothetical protein
MAKPEERSLIEKFGAIAVALTAILTLVFLLFPNLKPELSASDRAASQSLPPSQPSDAAPAPMEPREIPRPGSNRGDTIETRRAATSPGDVILGTWQQFGLDPAKSQWEYLGTFVVARVDGAYTMSAREQREDPGVVNSIGIFDVRSDGTSWSFNSNWGRGAVGSFQLQKVSSTTFEGTISLESQVVGRTKWVRTQ